MSPVYNPAQPVYRSRSALMSQPVVAFPSRSMNQGYYTSNGSGDVSGTSRLAHYLLTGANTIRLVYGNWYNNNGAGESLASLSPVTIAQVTVELATLSGGKYNSAGVFIPVFFAGQQSITLQPGAVVVSDPIYVGNSIPGKTPFWTRTYATWPASGRLGIGPFCGPLNLPSDLTAANPWLGTDNTNSGDNYVQDTGISANATGTNQTTTSGVGWLSTYGAFRYGPLSVIGDPTGPSSTPTVAIIGDSIADGSIDVSTCHDAGYIQRALVASLIGAHRVCRGNESSFGFLARLGAIRMQFVEACQYAICDYGTNDLAGTQTAAQTLANLQTIWSVCASLGIPVWQTTILPRTTSTDGFVTTTNQTPIAGGSSNFETYRQSLNASIRSANTQAGGGLAGIIDTAAALDANAAGTLVGANSGGGRYYCGPSNNTAYTADGTHPNQLGHGVLAPLVPVGSFV